MAEVSKEIDRLKDSLDRIREQNPELVEDSNKELIKVFTFITNAAFYVLSDRKLCDGFIEYTEVGKGDDPWTAGYKSARLISALEYSADQMSRFIEHLDKFGKKEE